MKHLDDNAKLMNGTLDPNPSADTYSMQTPEEEARVRVGDARPAIRLTTALADVVDQTIAALGSDPDVFKRDANLVQLLRVADGEEDRAGLAAGTPTIRIMPAATLRERLTRVMQFQRFDKRSEDWVDTLPSEPVVQAVLARGEYAGIRSLVGIVESPSIRPDGSIIQTPGYDRSTGFFFAPSVDFPPVPENPTKEDAERAFAELAEPFLEFPFASDSHLASTIAAILTIVARPAIVGCTPATVYSASTRGTGKTLTSDAVSTITTGRATAKMSWPPNDGELEKVLGAYALRGVTLINFDNVSGLFGGAPLDKCLTAVGNVDLRILGKSETPTKRWITVVMATGNNVMFAGDTSRRVLVSALESDLENPEDRQGYKFHPLLDWIRANRPRLVVAALTILRAWFVAGCPSAGCRSWGSFEAWSRIIPPAIVFAGGADPMLTRPSVTGEDDSEKRSLVAIIEGLERLVQGDVGLTTKEMLGALYTPERLRGNAPPDAYDDLRDAFEAITATTNGRPPSSHTLGNALRKFKKRVVGGKSLDSAPDPRTKSARWSVAGTSGTSGTSTSLRGRDGNSNPAIVGSADETSPRSPPSPRGVEQGEWIQ